MVELNELVKGYGGFKKILEKAKEANIDIVKFFNEQIIENEDFYKFLEVKFIEIKDGEAVAAFPYKKELVRRGGMINGGVVMAVVDLVIGISIMTKNEGYDQFTAELKVNFLEPLKDGPFVCKGRAIRVGKTLAVGEAEVYDANKKLCSKAIGTWYIVK